MDFEPHIKPGHCPECSQPATIWNDLSGVWECSYCNWLGRPVYTDRLAEIQPDHFKEYA